MDIINKLKNLFKKTIIYFFNRLGYHIQRNSSHNIPYLRTQSPSALNYIDSKFILLDIDVDLVREQHLAVGVKYDPLIKAVSKCIDNNYLEKSLKESLNAYYEIYKPETALDLFDLDKVDAPSLTNFRPWEVPYPWVDSSIDEWSKILQEGTKKENYRTGKKLTIVDGVHMWGPVSEDKLEVEVQRFHQLLLDIKNNGYKRNNKPDGDIVLDALSDENGNWRYINRGGTHRFSVLAALGTKKIKARIQSLIYRNDVEIWPNVISKMYTKEGALKLFDRFHNGYNANFINI